jgi:AmmeMemoRadiSam system protein A
MRADPPAPPPSETAQASGASLLALARAAIAQALGQAPVAVDESAEPLHVFGASFVTLTLHGQLRGCIGSLEARRTLLADVKANAVAAALHDPRFAPLTPAELVRTEIEVSVLSALQALPFDNEAHALAQLRPGMDGVVLKFQRYSSTFLPQVWTQLPSPAEFLAHLKYKAGLPPDFWAEGLQLYRYTVHKWKESEVS